MVRGLQLECRQMESQGPSSSPASLSTIQYSSLDRMPPQFTPVYEYELTIVPSRCLYRTHDGLLLRCLLDSIIRSNTDMLASLAWSSASWSPSVSSRSVRHRGWNLSLRSG
ncbi:unnamed protein product [Peronospora destructor]|uniref:Uncharacterized protein n=1 Tax=Peronospora destructor TaxID=86335 RepID=A0AAV0VH14_9STRA|nr:unnamed protein product [Peronospora destructor]